MNEVTKKAWEVYCGVFTDGGFLFWLPTWLFAILFLGYSIGRRHGKLDERDRFHNAESAFEKNCCRKCGGLLAPSPCRCERPPSWDVTDDDSRALAEFTP